MAFMLSEISSMNLKFPDRNKIVIAKSKQIFLDLIQVF